MKLEIEQYSYNRVLVQNLLRRKNNDYKNIASEFAVVACCPVFAVYFYIGEIIGFNDWIVERMTALSKFYQYSDITFIETDLNKDLDMSQFTQRD